jgi:ubiquinone/menaquinone biosynthesis C-methylase UbiE
MTQKKKGEPMANHFDQVARDWDANPMHQERTLAIAGEILKLIPIHKEMTALEFGSGTGLLSFALREHFAEITMMDSSQEMNKMVTKKINDSGVQNMLPWNVDLEKIDIIQGAFDIIFTQMALHHVKDIPALINKFHLLLNSEGYLAIADLYAEDGTFHDKTFDGHLGFEPEYLVKLLSTSGFTNISFKPCFEITRTDALKNTKVFPVFLMIAHKEIVK